MQTKAGGGGAQLQANVRRTFNMTSATRLIEDVCKVFLNIAQARRKADTISKF